MLNIHPFWKTQAKDPSEEKEKNHKHGDEVIQGQLSKTLSPRPKKVTIHDPEAEMMHTPKRKHALPRNWIASGETEARPLERTRTVPDFALFHPGKYEPTVEPLLPDRHESFPPPDEPGAERTTTGTLAGKSRQQPSALRKKLERRASGSDGLPNGVTPGRLPHHLSRRSSTSPEDMTIHGADLLTAPPPSDGSLGPAAAAKKAAVLKHLRKLETWRREARVSSRGRNLIEQEQEKIAREGNTEVMRLHYQHHPEASRRFDRATEEQQRRMLGMDGEGPLSAHALKGLKDVAVERMRPAQGMLSEQFPSLAKNMGQGPPRVRVFARRGLNRGRAREILARK